MRRNLQRPVSVVIPSFNGLELLKKNLPAVVDALRPGDEIIVADDASTDESVGWLESYAKKMPKGIELRTVSNKKNLRFGATVNKAVKAAEHDLIFLLNNDVSPQPAVLRYLLPHFENPKMFAVGCHEREAAAGGVSGGKNKLWFERGLFVHSRAGRFTTGPTAWASGGSALFDRSKWLKLGGFDSAYYPAYWEDIDVSFRARQQGWLIWFESKALVDHNHETTNTSVFGQRKLEVMSFKNSLIFLWRNGSVSQKLQHLLWLPYHLIVTNARTGGAFGQGWWQFLTHQFSPSSGVS